MSEDKITIQAYSLWEEAPSHLLAFDEENNFIHMDTLRVFGGAEKGMRPLKVMLASLGGCAAMDAVAIMRKMRLNLKGIAVEVEAEKEPESKPTRLTSIHMHFTVRGEALPPEKVEHALRLAVEKYCAVGQIVRKAVPVSFSYEISGGKES